MNISSTSCRVMLTGFGFASLMSAGLCAGPGLAYAGEGSGSSSWPIRAITIKVPSEGNAAEMQAASAKGDVLVGFVGGKEVDAVRWTAKTGTQTLPIPGVHASRAFNVSADGSAVGGTVELGDDKQQGFLWTQAKGAERFGSDWSRVETSGVSDDGALIAGTFWKHEFDPQAFYWTKEGGVQTLSGDPYLQAMKLTDTAALAVSGDGSTITGWAADSDRKRAVVFRWVRGQGVQDIGEVGAGDNLPRWMGVSRDGTIVVGTACEGAWPGASAKAFRWTEKDGLQTLIPDSRNSVAIGMASDGSRVFGMYEVGRELHFFVWMRGGGVRDEGLIESTTPMPVVSDEAILLPYPSRHE
ncbi:hypothetical protein [Trinickia sp.]|uniref:hypothetical protein n=1 Tax=Trinickia sp. TaxID=2571163 RepID=UPI003F7FF892